jgi:hypothetical protein
MAAEKFLGSTRPVGKVINTCETLWTIAGYLTVHVSSCDELSKGYRRTRISVENMAIRIFLCLFTAA